MSTQTTVKTPGSDKPNMIAILDSVNNKVIVRSFGQYYTDAEEIERWIEENGYSDCEYMVGDFEIDIDN